MLVCFGIYVLIVWPILHALELSAKKITEEIERKNREAKR